MTPLTTVMLLVAQYNKSSALIARIEQVGGRIQTMHNEHSKGRWVLDAVVPSEHVEEFEIYRLKEEK